MGEPSFLENYCNYFTYFFVLAFSFRNQILKLFQKETIKAYDKAKFTESDQILNELQLTEFIETLGINRCYHGQSRRADEFVHFFQEIGNQYLNRRLRKSCTLPRNEL